MLSMLLILLALAGCSRGPEGRGNRLGAPEAVPATARAAATPVPMEVICIRNRSGREVDFDIESNGGVRNHVLHDGEALHFRGGGEGLIRFTSVSDPPIRMRSRFYLIGFTSGAECRHVFRLDADGGVDLYGTGT